MGRCWPRLLLCLAFASCGEGGAREPDTDVEVTNDVIGTLDGDLGDDTASDSTESDGLDAAEGNDAFACTRDEECLAIIGGVDQCERAACNTFTGRCVRTARPDGTPCSDRNPCTTPDTCRAARCFAGAPLACDDGTPCTSDRCDPREGCVHTPIEAPCDDGDRCTQRDRCVGRRCQGTAIVCDDNDACTNDRCDPEAGCVYEPVAGCSADPG